MSILGEFILGEYILGDSVSIMATLCTGILIVLDEDGNPEEGVVIRFQGVKAATGTGLAIDKGTKIATSDADGAINRTFPAGGHTYQWWRGNGPKVRFTTALAAGEFEINNGIGAP